MLTISGLIGVVLFIWLIYEFGGMMREDKLSREKYLAENKEYVPEAKEEDNIIDEYQASCSVLDYYIGEHAKKLINNKALRDYIVTNWCEVKPFQNESPDLIQMKEIIIISGKLEDGSISADELINYLLTKKDSSNRRALT
jgi:hypothetical protein